MKKIILALTFAALIFTSCQDPMFYYIRQEVKLEDATALGDIYSIVRFTEGSDEKLFFANGKIFSKKLETSAHGAWVQRTSPDDNTYRVLKLAADSTNLYCLAAKFVKNDDEGEMRLTERQIWTSTDGTNWNPNTLSIPTHNNQDGVITNAVSLFCTNTVDRSARKAYVRVGSTLYELSGVTANSKATNSNANSVYGAEKFNNGRAACTYGSSYAYNDGNKIKFSINGGAEQTITTDLSTITSLAISKDSILATSESGGFKRYNITSKEAVEFSNASSALSSIYQSHFVIVRDPSKNVMETDCYCSLQVKGNGSNSAQFTHQGLWSYYPWREKWNIE